ncbi:MAG TPA: hypothetical protein VHJ79_14805 [Mycobacterium sp.]|nr:hypothetical protein [Mycobacterium sp.]
MPTPTGRASRKRYCNVACRKAAWRERHRHDTSNGDMVPHTVPDVLAVPTAFPDDVPIHGGHHRCPHCRQPLAIVSVVIPADAAIVKPPEVTPLTAQTTANLNPPPGEDDLATLGNFDERQHQRDSQAESAGPIPVTRRHLLPMR